MDWEQHRYGPGVKVTFAPRQDYQGRNLLPAMAERIGEELLVVPLWLMDEGDPYPGEWALGSADRRSLVMGRNWIASGDVTPVLTT